MTNERLGGIAVRFLLIPLLVGFTWLGGFFVYKFLETEHIRTTLESYQSTPASAFAFQETAKGQFTVEYSYQVNGTTYRGNALSHFGRANRAALANQEVRQKIRQAKQQSPLVYFNPGQPAESSLLRTWPATDDSLNGLGIGGAMVTLGLGLLYLSLRRTRRVEELFVHQGAAAGARGGM